MELRKPGETGSSDPIPVFSALGIYQKLVLGDFTIYSAFAIMGIPAWVIWATIRAFTLNRAINSYNSRIADFFGLDKDEKFMLDLD